MFGLQQHRLAPAVKVCADDRERSQRDALEEVGHEAQKLRVRARRARLHEGLRLHATAEGRAGVAELLVGDQAGDEHLTCLVGGEVGEVILVVLIKLTLGPVFGHEGGRLDLEQRGGHQQKVTRHVEVKLAHGIDLSEVLLGNLRDSHLPDVHLLAAHQREQQVKGSGVGLCAHAVTHSDHPRSTSLSLPAVMSSTHPMGSMPKTRGPSQMSAKVTGRA